MQFVPIPRRRTPRENIVPMINVVFLLLIFFLMTAQIAPPDPYEITLPVSSGPEADTGPATLYIAADGTLALEDARDAAVFDRLRTLDPAAPLLIRADRAMKAQDLARLLMRLTALGLQDVSLVTGARP